MHSWNRAYLCTNDTFYSYLLGILILTFGLRIRRLFNGCISVFILENSMGFLFAINLAFTLYYAYLCFGC